MSTSDLNCFVIMPFDPSFDDVYTVIKSSVESVSGPHSLKCFRLDESKPAGRITDRLLKELQDTTLCIGDLTGLRPNVMWEVGYAMALAKPVVILTQKQEDLPFDIRDMQSLQYNRSHLSSTLAKPLIGVIRDSLAHHLDRNTDQTDVRAGSEIQNTSISSLSDQVVELKEMVSSLVRAWAPATAPSKPKSQIGLERLQGAWMNRKSTTHLYARIVNGQLYVPYCYGGNNSLVAIYYDWKKTGDYWFARFQWIGSDIGGFAFLKEESENVLSGRWWYEGERDPTEDIPENIAQGSGVPSRWERVEVRRFPTWAETCFLQLERGRPLAEMLDRRDTTDGSWLVEHD